MYKTAVYTLVNGNI